MCSASSRSPASERGSALVLALLIVAVVAGLAVQFAYSFALSLSRAEYRSYGAQAQYYLVGAEALAAVVLEDDAAESEVDHLGEIWSQSIPPFPTDHGFLEARLEDAQGRLNLNGLRRKASGGNDPGADPAQRFTPEQRRFIRLLQTFDDYPLAVEQAIEITEAVIDWVDEDDQVFGFGGAEALHYSREDPPYQPANQLFSSVSELRLVRHMTPELYRRLEPFLVALPEDATLNVNTAPPRILRTINSPDQLQPLDERALVDLLEERELQFYETVGDFFSSPVVQNAAPNAVGTNAGYGVASEYFILHARASVDEQVRYLVSYLQRDNDGVRTIQRRYTSY